MRSGVVSIRLRNGAVVVLPVDIAETVAEQITGLSHRSVVKRGMAFPHGGESSARYGFGETRAPLDFLVFATNGTLQRIEHRVAPGSADIAVSGFPIGIVIELPGGRASLSGIGPGSRMISLH